MNGGAKQVSRLGCLSFDSTDLASLRSLLVLLQPYLKSEWVADSGDSGDLLLIDLDAGQGVPDFPSGIPLIGCARKPRAVKNAAPIIIHLPFRAAEVLAVLSEHDGGGAPGAVVSAPFGAANRELKLRGWPLDYQKWPRHCLKMMALLTRRSLTMRQLASRLGIVDLNKLEQCRQRLESEQLLAATGERSRAEAMVPRTRPWSRLLHAFRSLMADGQR